MSNPYFPVIHYAEAEPQLREIYDDIMNTFEIKFVPNFFKSQGSNFALLTSFWTQIKTVLFTGNVSRLIKEEIIYRISKAKECQYCSFVHARFIDELQSRIKVMKGEEQSEMLTMDQQAAVGLLVDMALGNQMDSIRNCERLQNLGFKPEQIPELLATASLTLMLNSYAVMSGIKIDEELLGS